jgi:hypothetical protein
MRDFPLKPRIASLTLAYNQGDYIEYCLKGLARSVGALLVMFSERPWTTYNPSARKEFHQVDNTRQILTRLQSELPHLRVIAGEWDCEEDMRNRGLAVARELGFELLLIVDADEFYHEDDLARIQELLVDTPESDGWWCRMRVPFKYCDYVIVEEDHYLPVVVRTREGVKFVNRRLPDGRRIKLPADLVCYNMGFVLPDDRMYEKMRTYGHAHEVVEGWFEEKWLPWTPDAKDLHPREPRRWPCVTRCDPRDYPEILQGHPLLRKYREEMS